MKHVLRMKIKPVILQLKCISIRLNNIHGNGSKQFKISLAIQQMSSKLHELRLLIIEEKTATNTVRV